MSIMLNVDQALIGIDIYYIEETKAHGHMLYHFIQSQEDLEEWKSKGYTIEGQPDFNPEKKIDILQTAWKRMTWKDYNAIVAQSIRYVGEGDVRKAELDFIRFRDLKLKTCLKKWNVKNTQGVEIPVTPADIDNLVPEVANEMIRVFEKTTELGDEDLKK